MRANPCIRRDSVTERLERLGFHSFIEHRVEFRGASVNKKEICVLVTKAVEHTDGLK